MNILKSSSIYSFFTLISRIFGFVRDVVFANVLGTGLVADVFFFQAEDGIRDSSTSRGLGDVYKRQAAFFSF